MFAVTRHSIEKLPAYSNSLATVVKPNDAFYLIFTSGMTGKPKRCIIEHASFISGAVKLAESWNINAAIEVWSRLCVFGSGLSDQSSESYF